MKHHCTFCGLNGEGMAFRSKSPGRVVSEIGALASRYGVPRLQAVDNIIDMRYLDTVLPALATLDDPPYLFYEVKANLRRDHLKTLRAGGVARIQPGIENLHDDVLQLLNKGNKWFINVQLLKWAQEFGIHVSWNFLSGAPGEADAWYLEMAEWLPLLFHLEPPGAPALSPIRYDRFSPYHKTPARYGLTLFPNRAYGHVYPLSASALEDLAYFFEDARQREREATPIGPGHRAMNVQLDAWLHAFNGNGGVTARLTLEDRGEHVIVRDTRPVAAAYELVLNRLEGAVLRACDSARTRDGLLEAVRADGARDASPDQVAAALERMKQLRLMLEWRGRLLSLPVAEPITPYVPDCDFGYEGLKSLLARTARTSLARQCLRSPYDVPVTELFPASTGAAHELDTAGAPPGRG
jgi:magnesium-protoporphyrin IX monomethyl ester (oxidative) cyclase